MEDKDKIYLTAKETAEFLGISKDRLAQLRASGKLTAIRWGIWLYNRREVVVFKGTYKFNRKSVKE